MFELVNGLDTTVEIRAIDFFSPTKAVYSGPLANPDTNLANFDLYDIPSPKDRQVQLYKLKTGGSFVGSESNPDAWTLVADQVLDFGTFGRAETVSVCGNQNLCGVNRCFNPIRQTCNSEYKFPLRLRLSRSEYFEMEPGETVSLFLFTDAKIYVEDRDAEVTGKSVSVLFCRVYLQHYLVAFVFDAFANHCTDIFYNNPSLNVYLPGSQELKVGPNSIEQDAPFNGEQLGIEFRGGFV